MTIPIQKEFLKDYDSFLIGPNEESKHFIIQQAKLLCVRATCEGCKVSEGCEYQEVEAQIYPLPHARRGLGVEEETFLVLKLRDGVTFEDLPANMCAYPKEALDERNLHFLMHPWGTKDLVPFKGQWRLYNYDTARFFGSGYDEYFEIYQTYTPLHRPFSMDLSAIEPRTTTFAPLAIGMPVVSKWNKIFEGEPKVIFREIEIEGGNPNLEHVHESKQGKLYCYLKGELDKAFYEKQCDKCPVRESCKTKLMHYKNVSGDWHGLNRDALYGKSKLSHLQKNEKNQYVPNTDDDSYLLGTLRKISKIVGLALCMADNTKVTIRYDAGVFKKEVTKTLTLAELFVFFNQAKHEIEIATPDGWQKLLSIFDTGTKECVLVRTDRNSTFIEVSPEHPLETLVEGWKAAKDLTTSDHLVTLFGLEQVLEVKSIGMRQTYDLNVPDHNHRFWANEISTHNCYGGSAWTVSRNMGETPDEAQEKIDAFFQELPDLLAYMMKAKRSALETGYVRNLFGRLRSVMADIAQGRKGIGYAERTALNHPIQSSAGDFLKISTIRISELIERMEWSPIWGDRLPQQLPEGTSYRDFIFCLFSSVHDELVSLIKDGEIETFSPLVYEAMQIEDVIKTFGVKYTLEMDSEFDNTRSWTSTEQYPQAKIYLLRHLLKTQQDDTQYSLNGYSIPFDSITHDLLTFINGWPYVEQETEEEAFSLVSTVNQKLYVHDRKFPQEFFGILNRDFSVPLVGVHVPA